LKSSPGLRIAIVATLCVQPFTACTNDQVDFTTAGSAGIAASAGRGLGGNGAGSAGIAHAGSAAEPADAGASGSPGEGGDAGAAGSGDAGSGNAGGEGGVSNAGQGGSAGRSGAAGASGGSAGHAGGGGGASGGVAGVGGVGGAGAGTGGLSAGTGGASAGMGGTAGAPPVCGNQVLEKGEQCDDGNTKSLDACSASCAFEQSQRANSIEQKFKTSSLCPKNAFGTAFEGVGQTALQAVLDQRVANGSLSLLFAFRGLRDLSGMSAETITLGMAYGVPSVAPNYDGKSDLDWWYSPADGQVDSGGLYSNSLGHLAEGVLDAEPDSLRIPLLSEVPIYVSNVRVRLTLGDTSAPLPSSGVAPGHLASENVRPGLVSFASGGPPPVGNGDPGQLCGSLSSASLSAVAIPAAYAVGGASPCSEGYASTRSFLDLLVGGCTVDGDELVAPTQPDEADPGAPAAGAGAPYRLFAGPTTHAVTVCRDKLGSLVTLSTCLNAAAYSSAYRLKTGRVIIK